jgi:hypothetical protein
VRNQKISQNEKEPTLSKLIYTQGAEIDLKATICTRSKNFQNNTRQETFKILKNLKGVDVYLNI